jgi:hypothetical protein
VTTISSPSAARVQQSISIDEAAAALAAEVTPLNRSGQRGDRRSGLPHCGAPEGDRGGPAREIETQAEAVTCRS